MLKRFLSVFFAIALGGIVLFTSSSTEYAYAKKIRGKKQKKVPVARAFRSGISFLNFEQVASMPFNERVQYLKLWRGMYKDIETFQKAFKPTKKKSKKSAALESTINEAVAFLLGSNAYAKGQDQGGRCADRCIFAYHLNEYEKPGGQCKRFPYGCSKPPSCDAGGGSAGYLCNRMVSGLTGRDACISVRDGRDATRTCEQKRKTLSDQYKTDIAKNVAAARKLFGFDGTGKKEVSRDFLKSDDARKSLQNLIDTMYDDNSMAALIDVLSIYKRAGIAVPTNDVEIKNFAASFDNTTVALDNLFGEYIDMCVEGNSQATIDGVDKGTNKVPAYLKSEEIKRRKRLKAAIARGEIPTNLNFLQQPECFLVMQRLGQLEARTSELAETIPIASDIAAPGEPYVPEAPPKDESTPIGCSTGGELSNSLVYNPFGRCAMCAMKKSVHNKARAGDLYDPDGAAPTGQLPKLQDYEPSKKWTALLSTMMKACGVSDHAWSDAKKFNEMYQTFGHCDSGTYDWDPNNPKAGLQPGDEKWLEDWGNYNYWNGDGMKPEVKKKWLGFVKDLEPFPDKEGHFARIFGISYQEATAVFCDKSQFEAIGDFHLDQDEDGRAVIKHGKKADKSGPKKPGIGSRVGKWFKGKTPQEKELDAAYKQCESSWESYTRRTECKQRERTRIMGSDAESVQASSRPTSSRMQRRDRGRKRVDYAQKKYQEEYKDELERNPDSNMSNLLKCMDESKRRAETLYGGGKDENPRGEYMCMEALPKNNVWFANQVASVNPPGNLLNVNKTCAVSHQYTRHGKNNENVSVAVIDVDVRATRPAVSSASYNANVPVMVDPNMSRISLSNNPQAASTMRGVTIDLYLPYRDIYDTSEYNEMTVQIPCSDYWSETYKTPQQYMTAETARENKLRQKIAPVSVPNFKKSHK